MKVKIGLFWVIEGKIFTKQEEKEINESEVAREYADINTSHWAVWNELCKNQYPNDDFATYPRGRILYSIKNNLYVCYRDCCITDEELSQVIEKFGLLEEMKRRHIVFEYDTHYACDKCKNTNATVWAVQNGEEISACAVKNDEVIESETFSKNQLIDFTSFCAYYGAYDKILQRYNYKTYSENESQELYFLNNDIPCYLFNKNNDNRNGINETNVYFEMLHLSEKVIKDRDTLFESVAKYYQMDSYFSAENLYMCYKELKENQRNDFKTKAENDSSSLQHILYRGENELTGNLIEITNGTSRILVECGTSLKNNTGKISEIEKKLIDTHFDAVFITHSHADHSGLAVEFAKAHKLYMGEVTKNLLMLKYPQINEQNLVTYKDGDKIDIYNADLSTVISVTPYLCDHSATDSYMLLFEHNGKKILYTGDFRSHGRKNYSGLLSRLPKQVDTLICEGTNEKKEQHIISEIAVQKIIYKVISENSNPKFVLVPTENIDRIVSIYKATIQDKRMLLVDNDEARRLEAVGGGVPHPTTFENVFVYYPKKISEDEMKNYINYKEQSLSYKKIAKKNNYTMIIKSSSISYLKKLAQQRENGLVGSTLIYSMWEGYKNGEKMQTFIEEIESLGINTISIHTSGHADNRAIQQLIETTRPMEIVKVHCENIN